MAGIADDIADGQSFGHAVVGAAVDFGLIAITKFTPCCRLDNTMV